MSTGVYVSHKINNDDIFDKYDNIFTWNYNNDSSDNSSSSSDDNVSNDYEYTSWNYLGFANNCSIEDAKSNQFIILKSFFDVRSNVVLLTAPPVWVNRRYSPTYHLTQNNAV